MYKEGGERMPLETVQKAEPVIGWKIINLEYTRPFWEIATHQGVAHHDGIPPVKGIARCGGMANYDEGRDYALVSDHSTEEFLACSCGWYAQKSHKRVTGGGWLAKVRLYGRVIECTDGYRATKQDILEVWPPDEYTGLNEPIELIPEQFPTVKWHLPEKHSLPAYTPKEMADETVHHIHFDPQYDILPRELVDQLLPNQQYMYSLPFLKNMSMALQLRLMTTNQGITMEMTNYNGERVLGPILFAGSKYHWYGPDGKPLTR
jgi:hypothetical protein